MKSPRNITATASLFLVFGLALTGCSGSAAPASDPPAKSEQAADTGELTQDNFAERISKAQLAAGSAHVLADVPGGTGGFMEGDISFSEDPGKTSGMFSMAIPTGSGQVLLVDGTMYLFMGPLTGGKYVDLSQSSAGADVKDAIARINPETQLQSFSAAIESFKAEPEKEQIDGVDITKITMEMNTKKLLANGPLAESAQGQAMTDAFGETMEYIMYVGEDDLIRRITAPAPTGSYDMSYYEWGKEVVVEAPTPDQLTDPASIGM